MQERDTTRLKNVKIGDIPPLLIMCMIAMNYIQTKPLFPSIIQTNIAISDHKTPAIQTNSNCLYGW